MKALTFSYDDGVTTDQRLISIFNKYGIKATFNITTGNNDPSYKGWYTKDNSFVIRNDFGDKNIVKSYEGHEIACHCRNHLFLNKATDDEISEQILGNRTDLEKIFGIVPCGMAYPYNSYDDRCIKLLKENGFLYAREGGVGGETMSFDLQENIFGFQPTCHHNNEHIFELAEEFINTDYDELKIFYIWGHSYEFEQFDNWDHIEKLCKVLSGHDDIFYGTNEEVFRLQADWENKRK